MHETPGNEQSTDASRRRVGCKALLLAFFVLLPTAIAVYYRVTRSQPVAAAAAPAVVSSTQGPAMVAPTTPPTSAMAPSQPAANDARPVIPGAKKNPVAAAANETPGKPAAPAAAGKPVQPAAPADPAQQQVEPPPAGPAVVHVESAAVPGSPAGQASTRIAPWPFGLVPGITPAVACARLVQESGGPCSARLDSGGALEVRVRPEDPDWPARLRESLDGLGWQQEQPSVEDGARYSRGTARGNERFEWTIAGRDWTLHLVAAPGH